MYSSPTESLLYVHYKFRTCTEVGPTYFWHGKFNLLSEHKPGLHARACTHTRVHVQ